MGQDVADMAVAVDEAVVVDEAVEIALVVLQQVVSRTGKNSLELKSIQQLQQILSKLEGVCAIGC